MRDLVDIVAEALFEENMSEIPAISSGNFSTPWRRQNADLRAKFRNYAMAALAAVKQTNDIVPK